MTPTVPTVTIRATYDAVYWPEVCERCGAETRTADGVELAYAGPYLSGGGPVCPKCGPLPLADVGTSEDPAEWGGWVDPANPWGTADDTYDSTDTAEAYGRGEPIDLVLAPYAAAEFLQEFPGGIWDYSESESEQRATGVYLSVTAHVSGPGAMAALEILGTLPTR